MNNIWVFVSVFCFFLLLLFGSFCFFINRTNLMELSMLCVTCSFGIVLVYCWTCVLMSVCLMYVSTYLFCFIALFVCLFCLFLSSGDLWSFGDCRVLCFDINPDRSQPVGSFVLFLSCFDFFGLIFQPLIISKLL